MDKIEKNHNSWFITGGCGFIGLSLIKHILNIRSNVEIRVLDNLSVGTLEDLREVCNFKPFDKDLKEKSGGVSFIQGDILDKNLCIESSKGVDCIVHLAANTGVFQSIENPRKDLESNVVGVFNMLEAARLNEVRHFVFASSGASAGDVDPPINEKVTPRPVSPYGSSKLAGEGYCSSYAKTFGVNTVSLRFGNVYGPGSKYKSSVVAKFIKNVLARIPCEIYGDGTQTRDFIFIHDLLSAIIKASRYKIGGEIFQIASSREFTILELAEKLSEIFNERGYKMKINFSEKRIGDVMRNFADTSKAKKFLDWNSQTSIIDGLETTVDWFIKNNRFVNKQ